MNKKTIVVLFGGQSSEHEVSRVSASTIISNLSQSKYYVLPVGITKEGKWMLYSGPVDNIKNGDWEKYGIPTVLSPDSTHKGLIKMVGNQAKIIPVDVVVPVLHGKWGEDGTVQGLLELAKIPYVGCGVLSSAISMDKVYAKIVAKNARINQADFVVVHKDEIGKKSVLNKIEKKLGFPCFIKPANAGSSVGITKAHDMDELKKGLELAAVHDRKILVEENITGQEIECGVLGNGNDISASTVGEVLAAAEFYDYDAKYNNAQSKTVIPAELDEDIINAVRKEAIKVFKAVDGAGLARIDFFLEKDTNRIVFNELNTLPGFTSISMYPKLWECVGKPIDKLLDELIDLAYCGK